MVEKILQIMRERGLKQADLARDCKISPVSLNRVLRGQQRLSLDQAIAIAHRLEISLDFLAGNDATCDARAQPPSPELTEHERLILAMAAQLPPEVAIARLVKSPRLERPED